jgi:Putative transposase of IS4/5 family (DUF4096)
MIRLTDEQWERIRDHFPEESIADGRPGRKPTPTRCVLEAVLWILNTGAQSPCEHDGEDVLAKARPGIRFNEHIEGDGPTVFAHACKMGLEGIVSNRKDSAYRSGCSLTGSK